MTGCTTHDALALAWLYDDASESPASPMARTARRQRVYETFAEALQDRWPYGGYGFHDFVLEESSGLSSVHADIEAFIRRRAHRFPHRLPQIVIDPLRPWPEAADLWLAEWLFAQRREGHANDWWVHVEPSQVIATEYVPILRNVWLRTIRELDGVTSETKATILRSDLALEGWGDGWCDVGLSLLLDTAPHPRVVHAGVTTD